MPDEKTAEQPAQNDAKAEQPVTDWEAKFKAQQRVNRDLETKFNSLRDSQTEQRDAFAKALGIKPEDTSDTATLAAQLAALRDDFTTTKHENTVLAVANEYGLSEADDLVLLRSVQDPNTMRTVAQRISKPSDDKTSAPGPRPDLTQGGRGEPVSQRPEDVFAGFLYKQLSG